MKAMLLKLKDYLNASPAQALPSWPRLRLMARYYLRRIDLPGVVAIGIFMMCPVFYLSAIHPEQQRLHLAQETLSALNEQFELGGKSRQGGEMTLEEQLAEYYRKFPAEESSPEWLEELMALAANNGLSLNDGEYKAQRDQVGKLVRYQMTLQVRGEFPQIRKFLTDLPAVLPVVALDNVQFARQKIADATVEAKIKLVLYLEQAR